MEPWSGIFDGLTFKAASDVERREALRRRGEIYEAELGYHGVDQFDERASHLVAVTIAGRVVSALRVIQERPLEIEAHLDLGGVVDENKKIAQIGGFWVDREWRVIEQHRFLQIGMLKLACMFGRTNGIEQFVTYTYSRLTPLYRAAYFQNLGLTFDHPNWGQVKVLGLDLIRLMERSSKSATVVARLLALDHLDNFLV